VYLQNEMKLGLCLPFIFFMSVISSLCADEAVTVYHATRVIRRMEADAVEEVVFALQERMKFTLSAVRMKAEVNPFDAESGWSWPGDEGEKYALNGCVEQDSALFIYSLNEMHRNPEDAFAHNVTGTIYGCEREGGDENVSEIEAGGEEGAQTFAYKLVAGVLDVRPRELLICTNMTEHLTAILLDGTDVVEDVDYDVNWSVLPTSLQFLSSDGEEAEVLDEDDFPRNKIYVKSSVPGEYIVKATPPGASVSHSATVNVANVIFANTKVRNLPALEAKPSSRDAYNKIIVVKHDEGGVLDLEESDFLSISPAGLEWNDVKDLFDIEIKHKFHGSGMGVNEAEFTYKESDPSSHDIYSAGLEIKCSCGTIIDRAIVVIYSNATKSDYDEWKEENDETPPSWVENLPKVYSKLGADNSDPEPDDDNWKAPSANTSNYHYDAAYTMRSKKISGGHGHQACYDGDGNLIHATITSPPAKLAAAGTVDNSAPGFGHPDEDVWPFIEAAQLDGNPIENTNSLPSNISAPLIYVGENLIEYFKRRPPHTGDQVEPGENSDP